MNLGFALEYSLGHITHSDNLKRVLARVPEITPSYVDIPYDGIDAPWAKLPGIRSNWSLRASIAAYLGMRPRVAQLDGALFHTQVTSLFSTGIMRRVPSVVSLDATPLQYDALGAFYGHTPSSNARLEAIKKRMNQRAFAASRHLVTWSEWAKQSLVQEYGVPENKITVIPPGIDPDAWDFPDRVRRNTGPLKLLFVGGDFPRKGGDVLLLALEPLLKSGNVTMEVVTQSPGVAEGLPNVNVHRGLSPNSDGLRALFAAADLFVFPTRGDCLPLAVMEALCAGLPVVTTDVGALSEAVTDGVTGLVVPVNSIDGLRAAVAGLVQNRDEIQRMSANARAVGRERFNATINYERLITVVAQGNSVS